MKKICIYLLVIGAPLFSIAQSQLPLVLKTHSTSEFSGWYRSLAVPVQDGGALIFGAENPPGHLIPNGTNIRCITRIDSVGTSLKNTRQTLFVNTSNSFSANTISNFIAACGTKENGALVTGYYNDLSWNSDILTGDGFFIKVDGMGDTIWCRKWITNTLSRMHPNSVNLCADSGFVFSGYLKQPNKTCALIGKISKSGQLQWCRTDSTTKANSGGTGVRQLSDSSFVVCGWVSDSLNKYNAVVWKFNKLGQLSWSKLFSGPASVNPSAGEIVEVPGGLIVFLCDPTLAYVKIDLNGNILWARRNTFSIMTDGPVIFVNGSKKNFVAWVQDPAHILVRLGSGYSINLDQNGGVNWFRSTPATHEVIPLSNSRLLFLQNKLYGAGFRTTDSLVSGNYQVIVTNSLATGNSRCFSMTGQSSVPATFSTSALQFSFVNIGSLGSFQPTIAIFSNSENEGCLAQTGINDLSGSAQWNIMPNPCTNRFFLSSDEETEISDIEIYNSTGKLCRKIEITEFRKLMHVDVQELEEGLYVIELSNKLGSKERKKMIISR